MKTPLRTLHSALCILLLALPLLCLHAETEEHILANRHEVRIGMGESFLGHLTHFASEPPYGSWMYGHMSYDHQHDYIYSTDEVHQALSTPYSDRYNYVVWAPHVFGEYMYRFNRWFGLGVQTDFYTRSNRMKEFNGYGDQIGPEHYESEFCWAVLPVARFTYLRRERVSLYSHIGLGVSANFSMTDHHVDYTDVLPAFSATLLGVSVGRDHWFGTFELGSFNTAANCMFMERLFSISAGYRF